MGNNIITVLVVENQTLLREALCDVLAAQPDIEIVGGVPNNEGAIRMAAETRPEIVLLDGAEPHEVITRIAALRRVSPESHCIVLTSFHHPELIKHALRLQVSGFLTKSLTREEVISAIRSVSRHPDQILLAVPRESLAAARQDVGVHLSSRELQIMENVAQGLSNGQIASRLDITEATVKRHLRNIFEKLGAVSRIDAVNKAKSMLVLGFSANLNGRGRRMKEEGAGQGGIRGNMRTNRHQYVVPHRAALRVPVGS